MSHRKSVVFSGNITGEGGEATCMVSATEVSLPGGNEVAYANYVVHNVSKNLPAGSYTLHTKGEAMPVRFTGEHWLAAGP